LFNNSNLVLLDEDDVSIASLVYYSVGTRTQLDEEVAGVTLDVTYTQIY